jgi:hypothetical protein
MKVKLQKGKPEEVSLTNWLLLLVGLVIMCIIVGYLIQQIDPNIDLRNHAGCEMICPYWQGYKGIETLANGSICCMYSNSTPQLCC